MSAVIKLPLFSLASTTKTPSDSPLIMRFLCGKFAFIGVVPIGNSEIIPPFSIMDRYSSMLFAG